MLCPFCAAEVHENALVCRACHRDVAVPQQLQHELDELLRMRDALRAQLADATAELERYRRWRFRRERRTAE